MIPLDVDVTVGLAMLAVGLAAGMLGGSLGVGGGILMVPAMVIFLGDKYGPNSFHVYKLAAVTSAIILSAPAAMRHTRARAVVFAMLPAMLPMAGVGAVAGVLLAGVFVHEQTAVLRQCFGVFLELTVLVNLLQEWRARRGKRYLTASSPMPCRRLLIGLVVGLPAGLIGGLLGIGGGVWAVPAQRQLLGIQIRNAIANSSFNVICIAVVAAVTLTVFILRLPEGGITPAQSWHLAFWLAPGALLGGYLGAGLTHRLPVRWLRYGFHILLVITGARLLVAG